METEAAVVFYIRTGVLVRSASVSGRSSPEIQEIQPCWRLLGCKVTAPHDEEQIF